MDKLCIDRISDFLEKRAEKAKSNSLKEGISKCDYYMFAGECSAYCEVLREIKKIQRL